MADVHVVASGFGVFIAIWLVFAVIGFGGLVLGVAALIDVARTPIERFGPWWDNTRQAWLVGIAVSFALPFGSIITGIVWFAAGRPGLRTTGVAGRPFWAGAPKPAPPPWPPYS
jgi:hypothetical protein